MENHEGMQMPGDKKEQKQNAPDAEKDKSTVATKASQHEGHHMPEKEKGAATDTKKMPGHEGHDMSAMGGMSAAEQKQMIVSSHEKIIWTHLTIVILGVFLITSPFTFGYKSSLMMNSDIISGALLIIFGFLSANPFRLWAPWGSCFVGLWLLFAPIIFWSPDASAFITDSIIGILVIALSVLIPEMPGMMGMMMKMPPGPETPPGWSYNPSSWLQRTPIIVLAWVGFFGSRYLSAYQLGYIDHAYDPFFGHGSVKVLSSQVSKSFPISDAGLGTISYTIELLMGYMGMSSRWRTMPWMVAFFGILVIPLGVVSIVLIILQPVSVGFWCTYCLMMAAAMIIMIPLTLDEVVAMLQFMKKKMKEGKPFWKLFWMGDTDTMEGNGKDERSPGFIAPVNKTIPAMWWGMKFQWNLVLATAIGIGFMFSPAALSIQGSLANSLTTIGALVVTFSVMAMADVGRVVRFINIPFGLWLIVAAIITKNISTSIVWTVIIAAVILILVSLPKGKISEKYGTFDRYIV
jgi:uncharacterized membrane protein